MMDARTLMQVASALMLMPSYANYTPAPAGMQAIAGILAIARMEATGTPA
jgi:hypothetical protein